MKKKSIFKTILKLLVFLGLAGYLVYALVGINRPKESPLCTGLDITIDEELCSDFINEQEIRDLLEAKKLYPEGKGRGASDGRVQLPPPRWADVTRRRRADVTLPRRLGHGLTRGTPRV